MCADGGANRLFDELPSMLSEIAASETRDSFVPDTIIGDMDSIRDEVKAFYVAHSARIVDLSSDQDSTDLKKCIRDIIAREKAAVRPHEDAAITVVVVGALGGRLDHELANLSILYEYHQRTAESEEEENGSDDNGTPRVQIVIVSDTCIAYVLPRGTNRISLVRLSLCHNRPSRFSSFVLSVQSLGRSLTSRVVIAHVHALIHLEHATRRSIVRPHSSAAPRYSDHLRPAMELPQHAPRLRRLHVHLEHHHAR